MKHPSLSIRNILLLIVSLLTMIIAALASQEVYSQFKILSDVKSLKKATFTSNKFFNVIDDLSLERDIIYSMLKAKDPEVLESLRPRLKETCDKADESMKEVLGALQKVNYPGLADYTQKTQKQFAEMNSLRQQIETILDGTTKNQNAKLTDSWFKESTELIVQTQELWMEFTKRFVKVDPVVTQRKTFKHFLGIIMEYASRERALIGGMIVSNSPIKPEEQAELLRWHGVVENGWWMIGRLADRSGMAFDIAPYISDAQSHYLNLYDMVKDIFYVPGAKTAPYPISVELWFELASQTTDSLFELKDAAAEETRKSEDLLEDKAYRAIIFHLIILFCALGLCGYSFWIIIRRVINPINNMIDSLLDVTEGRTVRILPPISNPNNEIRKLAQVLYVFQQNLEKIKQTSAMLERYTAELERSNKELDDFAYIASHDLKEPLRGISNHSRFLLEDNQGNLDEQSIKRLNRLSFLSQRIERLVNELLYFSRLGRQDLAIQKTDMNAIIHDIENTLDIFKEESQIDISITKPLPSITCDRVRITEVFRNLITNAIKYNNNKIKKIEIGFLDKYIFSDGKISKNVFYVKDNGPGIAPEFYDEIFRIFKRLQSSKNPNEEGTGVGLTFVKKIIERHGGKIWLESELGKGSVFYFTLEGGKD